MTERHLSTRLLILAGGLALIMSCNGSESSVQRPGRNDLSLEFLLGSEPLQNPASTAAYTPRDSIDPANRFEGRLKLSMSTEMSRVEVLSDLFDRAALAETLPETSIELVQDGTSLIPVNRSLQAYGHSAWQWIFETGRVWDEAGDAGWTRASLPFALVQRNANCTHNGLLTFLFKTDGRVSRVAYQVGSETCFYFQANLWGLGSADYQPRMVNARDETIANYRRELAARLPVQPMENLTDTYPAADLARFRLHEPEEVTTYGFIIDGVHYSGGCKTRFGPYPYCQSVILPSYSLAKTIVAGTVYMQMEQMFPGIGQALVVDYVPECRGDDRWKGVTLQHLLDMSSGNYRSTVDQKDEFFSYEGAMFSEETHAAKITDACTLFPRAAEPGETWVYHTSDTYIAGALMNAYLQEQLGPQADMFNDLLVERILAPLAFSPAMKITMRTYDTTAQPFSGYGLFLLPDDIARFALFLLAGEGRVGNEQVLNRNQLSATLQRNPEDPGMRAGSEKLRYNNGLWAANVMPPATCTSRAWLPFMSGYGGISVVLMPNNSVYYVFSDGAHFKWAEAAAESNKLIPFCEKNNGPVP